MSYDSGYQNEVREWLEKMCKLYFMKVFGFFSWKLLYSALPLLLHIFSNWLPGVPYQLKKPVPYQR